MNKKKQIIKAATKFIQETGVATTLDVKNYLRKNYPGSNWKQHYVSNIMREAYNDSTIPNLDFRDNGTFREYYLKTTTKATKIPSTTQGSAQHSYALEIESASNVTASLTLKGSVEDIIEAAEDYGVYLRWSTTKNEFSRVQDMHLSHLANAVKKDVAAASGPEEVMEALTSHTGREFGMRMLKESMSDLNSNIGQPYTEAAKKADKVEA